MMRKAYIVTAYNQIDYLNRFTDSLLADGTSDVFIHLDKKKDSLRKHIATNEHIRLIVNNLAVEWGGWSFLMAIIPSWREPFLVSSGNIGSMCASNRLHPNNSIPIAKIPKCSDSNNSQSTTTAAP